MRRDEACGPVLAMPSAPAPRAAGVGRGAISTHRTSICGSNIYLSHLEAPLRTGAPAVVEESEDIRLRSDSRAGQGKAAAAWQAWAGGQLCLTAPATVDRRPPTARTHARTHDRLRRARVGRRAD